MWQSVCSRSQPRFVSSGLQFIQHYKQRKQQVHQGRVSIVNRHCFWLNSLAFLPYYVLEVSLGLTSVLVRQPRRWFAGFRGDPKEKGVNGRRILVRRR